MRTRGILTWFGEQKGSGFITLEDGGDCFVHHSAFQAEVLDTLKKGDSLEFDVVDGPKGPAAENVVRVLASVEDEEERDEVNAGEWEEEVTQRVRREIGNDVWE